MLPRNGGDLESLLELLTDGVIIINPYGEMITGRDAVDTMSAWTLSQHPRRAR